MSCARRLRARLPHWVEIGGPIAANNGNALQEAARQGMGILREPTFIAAEAIRQGRLAPILKNFRTPVLDMFAVFPGNRFVPQRVRAFVDILVARLGASRLAYTYNSLEVPRK